MSLRLRTISSPQILLQDRDQRAILIPFASAVLILGVTPAAFWVSIGANVATPVHQLFIRMARFFDLLQDLTQEPDALRANSSSF